jgi:hypothetical protein
VRYCGCQVIARSLCWRHYQHWRRHRRDPSGHGLDLIEEIKEEPPERPPPAKPNNGYDVRFCNLFVEQLETRHHPNYPTGPWFTALSRADYEYRHLPLEPVSAPVNGYRPPETAGLPERPRQLYANNYGNRSEVGLRQVNAACTRWLSSR